MKKLFKTKDGYEFSDNFFEGYHEKEITSETQVAKILRDDGQAWYESTIKGVPYSVIEGNEPKVDSDFNLLTPSLQAATKSELENLKKIGAKVSQQPVIDSVE